MSDQDSKGGIAKAVIIAAVVLVLAPIMVFTLLFPSGKAEARPCSETVTIDDGITIGRWKTPQLEIAALIVNIGTGLAIPRTGLLVALITGMQESGLTNLPGGDRDSLGIFQQRPSQGWGTTDQITDPDYSTRAFYGGPASPNQGEPPGLLDIARWEEMTPSQAAQAVQRSAFPDAYAKHVTDAEAILAMLEATATECSDDDESGETVDATAVAQGQWGGFPNGQIPLDSAYLCTMAAEPKFYLRCDGARAMDNLMRAYKAEFGTDLKFTGTYRTLQQQIELARTKPGLAAKPGTSNHGWATAVDFSGLGADNPQHQWMQENAPKYGWAWPQWARKRTRFEPWHWEFAREWNHATR